MVHQSVDLLYKKGSDSYVPLPSWADYFVRVGYVVAGAGVKGRRLVTALAVPTRAYAAALVGVGIVLRRSEVPDSASVSALDHFNWLCSQDIGTPVTIKRGKNVFEYGFIWEPKVEFRNDNPMLVVKTAKRGNLISMIPVQSCLQVQVSSNNPTRLPSDPRPKTIDEGKGFVTKVMRGNFSSEWMLQTRMDLVFIGHSLLLFNEIAKTEFAVKRPTDKFESGVLNDILNVKRFSKSGHSYKSDLLPVNGKLSRILSNLEFPTVSVFDGAGGFLRWRDCTNHSDWIVILDRTNAHCDEASNLINTGYMTSESLDMLDFGPTPKGIEFICYREPN